MRQEGVSSAVFFSDDVDSQEETESRCNSILDQISEERRTAFQLARGELQIEREVNKMHNQLFKGALCFVDENNNNIKRRTTLSQSKESISGNYRYSSYVHRKAASLREFALISRSAPSLADGKFIIGGQQGQQVGLQCPSDCNCGNNTTGMNTRRSVVVKSQQIPSPMGLQLGKRKIDIVSAAGGCGEATRPRGLGPRAVCDVCLSTCETHMKPVKHIDKIKTPERVLIQQRRLQSTSMVNLQQGFEEGGDEIFPFGENNFDSFKDEIIPIKKKDFEAEKQQLRTLSSDSFPFGETESVTVDITPVMDEDKESSTIVEDQIAASVLEGQRASLDELSLFSDATLKEEEIIPVVARDQKLIFRDYATEDEILPVIARNQRMNRGIVEEEITRSSTDQQRDSSDQDNQWHHLMYNDTIQLKESEHDSDGLQLEDVSNAADKRDESDGILSGRSTSELSLVESMSSSEELSVHERIQNVNRAFAWVRAELLDLRAHDITLKVQFDCLRQDIRTMLEEVEEYNEENNVFYEGKEDGPYMKELKESETCNALREDSGYHSDTPSQAASDNGAGGLEDKPQTLTHAQAIYYFQPLPSYTQAQKATRGTRDSSKCVFEIVL